MLTAVTFLAILTVSVLIHELAHYLNARSVGVPVRAFSVGMGPILLRRPWRGTEWRLSLLPIGGYVDLPGLAAEPGEDGTLRYPEEGFSTKTLPQKLWVLVGGVLANFVLAVLLIAVVITADPIYRMDTAGAQTGDVTQIMRVVEGSAAARLGLEPGDRIIELNDVEKPTPDELVQAVRTGGTLRFTVDRGGDMVELETLWNPAPNPDGSRPLFGISHGYVPPAISFPAAVGEATTFLVRVIPESVGGFFRGFGAAVTGAQNDDVAGPVQIVSVVGQAARVGILPVLFIAGLINFSLAIFNLLPIPGLDGGRMLLAVITAVRGRPFKPGQEEFIHFLGFMTVLAFIFLITFREVGDLVTRG